MFRRSNNSLLSDKGLYSGSVVVGVQSSRPLKQQGCWFLPYCLLGWADATVVATFFHCLLSLVAFLCLLSTIFPGCFPPSSLFLVSFLPLLCPFHLTLSLRLSSSVSDLPLVQLPQSCEAFYVIQFTGSPVSAAAILCQRLPSPRSWTNRLSAEPDVQTNIIKHWDKSKFDWLHVSSCFLFVFALKSAGSVTLIQGFSPSCPAVFRKECCAFYDGKPNTSYWRIIFFFFLNGTFQS